MRMIVVEAAMVAIVGLAIGLAANELSPRGLDLSRNYFPSGTNQTPAAQTPTTTEEPSPAAELSERLHGKGLQELKRNQVEILFHDPRIQDGRVVIVDARDEDDYQEGHIPGAYELDPYHPEKDLGTVLPICRAAEEVVVYCTSSDCEDSDTASILLRDGGVPGRILYVYGGGFNDWEAAHLPVETGARNSGATNISK